MPRPCKRRRICAMPSCQRFGPKDSCCDADRPTITMTLDEFESIRLIDLEGLTQEQCAERMNVARTTAQAIYNSARIKLAECLVQEKELRIAGGDYILCDGNDTGCSCNHSCKGHCHRGENNKEDYSYENRSHL